MNATPRCRVRHVATALAVAACAVGIPRSAIAASPSYPPVVVTTTADVVDPGDGVTSLREAFSRVAGEQVAATIQLATGATYTLACTVAGDEDANAEGDLDLQRAIPALTLEGHGATITTAASCADERLIEVRSVAGVTVRDLHLIGGRGRLAGALVIDAANDIVLERVRIEGAVASAGICTGECLVDGAARLSATGAVRLVELSVSGNTADLTGCHTLCIGVGGLDVTARDVTLDHSLVVANHAGHGTCTAGCIVVGGIRLSGPGARLTGSRIADNVADASSCGRCEAVGGLRSGATLSVERSAVIANRAVGGGLTAGGASVETTVIAASTVSGNEVAGASPAHAAGLLRRSGGTDLRDTTIVDNVGPDGASNLRVLQAEQIVARGTVIGSAGGASGCALGVAVSTASASFESGRGCFDAAAGVIADGGDPRLAPATGDQPWRAPLASSPLIDGGEAVCGATDQAGGSRPYGASCDIGAIEYRPAAGAPVEGARFVPVAPTRLFDTRPGSEPAGPKGVIGAGESLTVQVAGSAGVPAGAVAVALNVTATEASGPGYVTVWPAGAPRPEASSLNLTAAGQTRANLVIVPLPATGGLSFFAEQGTHLLADVAGYYAAVAGPQRAGRIVALTPQRLFDTRTGSPPAARPGLVVAGETTRVPVTGHAGVPASGVVAVVVNVTATEAVTSGYVTVWPSGSDRPNVSTVNLDGPADTAPNLAIVPLGADGAIELFSSAGAHLLADVTGYVTDASAPEATTGLFVPLVPTRAFDTRPDAVAPGPKGAVAANSSIAAAIAGTAGLPVTASGVVLNLTATEAGHAGFVTVWPSGGPRPLASTLNVVGGDTRANAALVPLGGGAIDLHTSTSTHLLGDVAGFFLP